MAQILRITHQAARQRFSPASKKRLIMPLMQMPSQLTDRFGRSVNYLRLSVTDRCDFRCTYCMAEDMQFLPRKDILSLEELYLVAKTFTQLGTKKIRITGGEPLIRSNILELITKIGALDQLHELCLTTNGSHLAKYAEQLKLAGVKALNISLDSLSADRFAKLTRVGKLESVLAGIDAALEQKFQRIKINSVVLKNYNLDEVCDLIEFVLVRKMDISFIEEMPLGEIQSHSRELEFISSEELRARIQDRFKLQPMDANTLGPSRYWRTEGYQSRIGFISPHSHNFCASCNRVRVTASGRLLLCLGNEHSVDLRDVIRRDKTSVDISQALKQSIIRAMNIKPEKHEFNLNDTPQVLRFMNATGG